MATTASQVAGAVVLVLMVLGAAEGQVLPTPCCRWNCCDGRRECCDPGFAADDASASAAPPFAGVPVPRPDVAAGRKVVAGN
ncbi:hypothetical protein ACP4OV_006369 [Aristida adscensionis]